jgi:hypothetical protein
MHQPTQPALITGTRRIAWLFATTDTPASEHDAVDRHVSITTMPTHRIPKQYILCLREQARVIFPDPWSIMSMSSLLYELVWPLGRIFNSF